MMALPFYSVSLRILLNLAIAEAQGLHDCSQREAYPLLPASADSMPAWPGGISCQSAVSCAHTGVEAIKRFMAV